MMSDVEKVFGNEVAESVFSKLLAIKDTLPIQKKEIHYTNRPSRSPDVGDIILRPAVTFLNGELDDMWNGKPFKKTDRGTYSMRVDSSNMNCPGYSVSLSDSKGQVCFSHKEPPKDWTHFKVTAVSKNGKSLFVEPVSGPVEELKLLYKKEPSAT